jgi:hypothetical protein
MISHGLLQSGRLIAWAILLICLPARRAQAQGNYASTPTGGRSALMGNTGVAMASDGSAPFNNPATIVRINDAALAFSVNFYSYELAHYSGWHEPGRVDPAFGRLSLGDTSLDESRVDVIPSTLCLFFTVAGWGDAQGDPELLPNAGKRGPRGRQKLAACVGNVERQRASFPAINFRAGGTGAVINQAQSVTQSWDRFRAGPTYSVYLNDRVAVGVSLHGIYTAYGQQWSSSSVIVDPSAQAVSTSLGAAADGSSLDLAAILGITYRFAAGTTLGASVSIPSLHVTGTYDAYLHNMLTGAGDRAVLSTGHGNFIAPSPLRVAVGLGTESRRLRVEVDEALYVAPADALRADLHVDTVTAEGGSAQTSSADMSFRAGAGPVINSSMGIEVLVSPAFSLFGGMSTDFSAAPSIPATSMPSLSTFYQEKTNRVLLSLGLGSHGEASDLLIGTQLNYGWGKALAVNSFAVPTDLAAVDETSFGVLLIVAGNVSLKALEGTVRRVEEMVRPPGKP